MTPASEKARITRYPTMSLSAEHLVMGYLLRRNILAYKAPPLNEGYDLICIHPDPRKQGRQIRVQVKSRMATDCNRAFPVKGRTIDAFDYLIVVFLNVGYFLYKAARHRTTDGIREPEFFTFSSSFIREHHDSRTSWGTVRTGGLDIERFKNAAGLEQIAKDLAVRYPDRTS